MNLKPEKSRNHTRLRLIICILMIVVGNGCVKSGTQQPVPANSYVSVMHLAPSAPSLDIYFDDEKVSNNPFTPGSVSGAYNSVDIGSFAIKFKKSGSDSTVATVSTALYDSLRYYTILIYNLQANGPAQAVRIEDDFSAVVLTKPVYRFFHASPNTGGIDLYMDNVKIESGRLASDNTTGSFNNFRETVTGLHTFQVKLAGTDSVIVTRNDLELGSGNAYTLFLKGLRNGSGNNALALEMLRAVN